MVAPESAPPAGSGLPHATAESAGQYAAGSEVDASPTSNTRFGGDRHGAARRFGWGGQKLAGLGVVLDPHDQFEFDWLTRQLAT